MAANWSIWTSSDAYDPLLFASFADQQLAVLFGNDVALETLEGYLSGIFGMDDAIRALEETDIADSCIAVRVLGQPVMQRCPIAQM